MSKYTGRSVLITGSAHGIGAGTAIKFAEVGYSYIGINYASDEEGANQVAARVKELGAIPIVIKADVREEKECERLVNTFIEKAGKIDVLINNAGGGGVHPEEPFEYMPLDYWESQLHLNLYAAMYCCRFAIRDMKAKGTKGHIVNISSKLAYTANVERKLLPYSCAKGGINSFTMALANEVAQYGIVVNAIAPGLILTPITESRYDDEKKAEFLHHMPVNELGRPEDIAHAAIFLADEETRYMIGQTILIDGGETYDGVH